MAVDAHVGNGTALPFAADPFDAVVVHSCSRSCPSRARSSRSQRALAPDGAISV
jgi:hypothetical protein